MICLAKDVMCLHEPRFLCLDSPQTLLQEKGNEGPPAFHDMVLWVRDIKDRQRLQLPDMTCDTMCGNSACCQTFMSGRIFQKYHQLVA